MKWAIVILAGGEGRRIGGGKPFRMLAGRPLIEHVMDRARNWSPLVAISVRDPAQLGGVTEARLLPDGGSKGPIAGVASALAFAEEERLDGVLTLPCDTPLLPIDLLARLEAAEAIAAVAASAGRLHPSCTLWRRAAAQHLPDYLASGRSSLKGFAQHLGMATVTWPTDPFDPFLNVNDAQDLLQAEQLLRNR